MKKWKCSVCGYVHTGDTPPEKCPVCGADQSLFTLMESGAGPAPTSPGSPKGRVSQWRCTVCGYVHTGETPPEKCPVCGADQSLFVPVPAAELEAGDADDFGPTLQDDGPYEAEAGASLITRIQQLLKQKPYDEIVQRVTELHGHPIAVHIPNGLLPVSVLFTVLAIMFGSDGFATAARYNTCLVALAMPLVVATGLVDWINRFGGRMTQVFKIKMVCAATVTLLTIFLAFWWIANPEIFSNGILSNLFFLVLNLVNLAAAGIAGWYGGKLVFKK